MATCAAAALAILFAYRETALSMYEIWRRSDTFGHCVAVVPIVLWLVWRRRLRLATLPVRPFWPAMLVVVGAGIVWLIGSLADANVVTQFALVLMIQGAMLSICGLAIGRALAFPLFFLFFSVPFGEAFVPKLMDWTADVTVLGLKFTGVPIYREGNTFVIPSGSWSVVEACSGIRYLIASLMVGTLYAHLMYTSWMRRAAFVAASAVVPLIANWMRAYLIVMLGHLSDNKLAAGVDHLIYGWVFFGIVLLAMFWVGARYREIERAPKTKSNYIGARSVGSAHPAWAAVIAVGLAVLWSPIASVLASGDADHQRSLRPIEEANGWISAAEVGRDEWQPRFSGQRVILRQAFERGGDRVIVHVYYYAAQKKGAELVNSDNVLVTTKDPYWREVVRGQLELSSADRPGRLRTATLAGDRGRFNVAWWYWVGGRSTTSDAVAKLWLAEERLGLRGDDSAAVFLSTEPSSEGSHEGVLQQFATDMGPSIERTLVAARKSVR